MTWLVTRQVVTPVRMARRVAERLAAGQLQERLRVSGEDDLARLATSFNQMASNLQRQIRQLEELSRVQRRFVSDVSHELRTPLTTVRMAGDVLHDARDDFDPTTARAAELLQTELDRFETLLVDLLEISRFDAGAAVLELDDVNLVDVAHRVVDATRPLADAAQRRGRGRGARPPVPGRGRRTPGRADRAQPGHQRDRPRRRPSAPAATSWSSSSGDDHAAAIAVRDYGVGLAPGESAMVFNRFWRADPARARTSGGTGLGPVDLARGHPPARRLAAGLGPARRGRPVPADPAPARRRRAAAQPAAAGARRRHGAGRVSRARRAPLAVVAAARAPGCSPAASRMPDVGPGRRDPGPTAASSADAGHLHQPAAAAARRHPRRHRARVPDRDAGDPDPDQHGARVPHRGRRRGLGARTRPSPTPATRGVARDRGRGRR